MNTIDFAIDLGTTNSLIAKYQNGVVKVFKNPRGFKESLPSVVAFRKNGVVIGDKARELKDTDFKNVFSSFKRRIGTDASYFVENEGRVIKPQDLSSLVLKELHTFVIDQTIKSVVITIPASFSTVQSNATKEAGYDAGFEEIVLLQEPIAASLAVFNSPNNKKKDGHWLVFDLGGGTFDVAIVEVSDTDLKIVDHEGNNFLGGLDFDTAIVNDVIIPRLLEVAELSEFIGKLNQSRESQEFIGLFEMLLVYAEQLKMELTSFEKAFIEIPVRDGAGELHYVDIELEVARFNEIITPFVSNTIGLVNDLLGRNGMKATSLEEVVLVGGSTYVPYLREVVTKELGVTLNQDIDPSTAIVVGAAYYAGNKESKLEVSDTAEVESGEVPGLDMFYDKNARDLQTVLLVNAKNFKAGNTLRITRSDNGFDSGYLAFKSQMHINLTLLPSILNEFKVEVYKDNNLIEYVYPSVAIRHGHYSIDGQPIPNDICIEVDDTERGETLLEPLFFKNDILPLVKTIYKTISKDILSTSDDVITINILEGDRNASPSTNITLGQIDISPKELGQNLYKGMDLGIVIEINESRDLKLTLNLMSIDREINESFKPNQRTVNEQKLRQDLARTLGTVKREIDQFAIVENYEAAAEMSVLQLELENCQTQLGKGSPTEDTLFSVDEQKRKLGGRLDRLSRDKVILKDVEELRDAIEEGERLNRDPEVSVSLRKKIEDQIKIARNAMLRSNVVLMRHSLKAFYELFWEYRRNNVDQLKGIFFGYSLRPLQDFEDPSRATTLITKGEKYLAQDSISSIDWIYLISALYNCLKSEFKDDNNNPEDFSGTGLE